MGPACIMLALCPFASHSVTPSFSIYKIGTVALLRAVVRMQNKKGHVCRYVVCMHTHTRLDTHIHTSGWHVYSAPCGCPVRIAVTVILLLSHSLPAPLLNVLVFDLFPSDTLTSLAHAISSKSLGSLTFHS